MTTTAMPAQPDINGPEPDLKRVMGPRLLLLFIIGDILGAGVYAAHRPDPWPATFGYHEVFHALVVGGVAAIWALASLLKS